MLYEKGLGDCTHQPNYHHLHSDMPFMDIDTDQNDSIVFLGIDPPPAEDDIVQTLTT